VIKSYCSTAQYLIPRPRPRVAMRFSGGPLPPIEPVNNPAAYDRVVFLVLKEFLPSFSQGAAIDFLAGAPVAELPDNGK
jgi:hypothetical protein